jgi:hypothetical protein
MSITFYLKNLNVSGLEKNKVIEFKQIDPALNVNQLIDHIAEYLKINSPLKLGNI